MSARSVAALSSIAGARDAAVADCNGSSAPVRHLEQRSFKVLFRSGMSEKSLVPLKPALGQAAS